MSAERTPRWHRLATSGVYDGYTTVRRDTYRLPDGSVSDWDVLVQGDTVALVAVTKAGRALLFEQYRVGPQALVRELPGGLIDAGETAVQAAARELLEETGYVAEALFAAGSELSGANSTRRTHVVIAAGCRQVADPAWEAGETGTVLDVGLHDLIAHLLSGELSDAGEAMRALHVFVRSDVDEPALRRLQKQVRSALEADATTPAGAGAIADDIDRFWDEVDLDHPDDARAALEARLAAHGADDARSAYERASLYDALGEEDAAIPLYRRALEAGLGAPHRTQATIQLASSLRNVGQASAAIAALRGIPDDDPLVESAHAFLSLALYADEKPAAALRLALQTLAPNLPRYQRAVDAYAKQLTGLDRVRAIAVGLLVQDGKVLLEAYPANERHGEFLRAPGGGIEFGETAGAAIAREYAEELDADLEDAELLAVTENIFDSPTGRGHEIVHVFRVSSMGLASLGVDERLPVRDSHTTAGWYDISALRAGQSRRPVYPVGVLDLLG